MLATPGGLPPAVTEERWAFEVKQDGQRAMVYLPGDGTVLLRSRSGADIQLAADPGSTTPAPFSSM